MYIVGDKDVKNQIQNPFGFENLNVMIQFQYGKLDIWNSNISNFDLFFALLFT